MRFVRKDVGELLARGHERAVGCAVVGGVVLPPHQFICALFVALAVVLAPNFASPSFADDRQSSLADLQRQQAEAKRRAYEAWKAQRAAQYRARLQALRRVQQMRRAQQLARQRAQQQAQRARLEAQKAAQQAQREAKNAAQQAQREAKKAAQRAQREARRAARKAKRAAAAAARAAKRKAAAAKRKAAKAARQAKKKAAKSARQAKQKGAPASRQAKSGPAQKVVQPKVRAAGVPTRSGPASADARRNIPARTGGGAAGHPAKSQGLVPVKEQGAVPRRNHALPKLKKRLRNGNVAPSVDVLDQNEGVGPTEVEIAIPDDPVDVPAASKEEPRVRAPKRVRNSEAVARWKAKVRAARLKQQRLEKQRALQMKMPAAASAPAAAKAKAVAAPVQQQTPSAKKAASVAPKASVKQLLKASRPEQQLIATGLAESEVGQAAEMGLAASAASPMPGGGQVRRVVVPEGLRRDEARALLTKQMPLTRFLPNHTHRIFTGQIGKPGRSKVAGGVFGAQLINWRRELRGCTKNIRVGIIDTSFDTTHPVFENVRASFGDFLEGDRPSANDWHGTAVLSLLAGDPSSSVPGLIPDASFYLATAFRSDEDGNASTDTVRLLAALQWLDGLGVKFVNMSFSGPRDELLEAAIRRMQRKGVIFIAAAGNHGPAAPPSYPAAYPGVIAVTAINRRGNNYRHANRGTFIDLSAPGVDVLTALPGGKTGLRTGTSFAAPFITAIMATRYAGGGSVGSPSRLIERISLRDLGPPGHDPIYGRGLALAPTSCRGGSDAIADGGQNAVAPDAETASAEQAGTSPFSAFPTQTSASVRKQFRGAMSVGIGLSDWTPSAGFAP